MPSHSYMCPLRWSDMDIYGVVNNVSFVRLLEEGRVDLIWRLGSGDRDAFFAGGSVVVRHVVEYKRPLVHRPEPVEIEMWVSDLDYARVVIDAVVRDGPTVYAVASTTMAPFNYEKRFPRRMSEEEMAFFDSFREPRTAVA